MVMVYAYALGYGIGWSRPTRHTAKVMLSGRHLPTGTYLAGLPAFPDSDRQTNWIKFCSSSDSRPHSQSRIEVEVESRRQVEDTMIMVVIGGNVGDDGGSENIILVLKSAREWLWKT